MLLAILSDTHDDIVSLQQALQIIQDRGCQALLFAGDLIAPPVLNTLCSFPHPIHMVWGNNEGEKLGVVNKLKSFPHASMHGDIFEGNVENCRIFMNHYPRPAEIAGHSGFFDLAVHGHTHEYREEKIGDCLLINPGAVYQMGSFILFDTATRQVEKISL